MTVDFREWSDAYALHAQKMGSAITSLCSAVRDLRTAAVRKSKSAQAKVSFADISDVCNHLKSLDLILAGAMGELQGPAPDEVGGSGVGDFPPEVALIRGKTAHLQDVILKLRRDVPEFSMSEEKTAPTIKMRAPGLLQKGAKQFAVLAEIFQLQDRFEQRNEHILAGFAAASNVADDSRVAMFQIVNAQANGVAEMTLDYLQHAEQSATSLASMEAAATEKELETTRQLSGVLEPIQSRLAIPTIELIELCDSATSDLEVSSGGTAPDEINVEQCDGRNTAGSNINNVSELSESLRGWDTKLSAMPDDESMGSDDGTLQQYLTNVAEEILALRTHATGLKALSSDHTRSCDPATTVGPEFAAVIADITSNFTMDSERDDHRAAMHRLGLA